MVLCHEFEHGSVCHVMTIADNVFIVANESKHKITLTEVAYHEAKCLRSFFFIKRMNNDVVHPILMLDYKNGDLINISN